jgi:hypothetical protein
MVPPAPGRHLPRSPFNSAREAAKVAAERFAVGDRVTHDRHGMGVVTGLDGDAAVYVDFGAGVRRLILPTSKLHVL